MADDRLLELHGLGQSPWLDNLRRGWLTSGELARWVDRGIRGLTSNPSIFQKAISSGRDYDEQFGRLVGEGVDVDAAYWDLVVDDIRGALALLRPVYDASDGVDGYVSIEVAPDLARDSAGTESAARALHERIAQPNLYVKIPGTAEGLAPIRTMIAEKRSINVTLIFGLDRYEEVMEAYLSGLEAAEGDLSRVASVASFFVSRVDTEVDRRLDEIGTEEALALKGRTAVAQAQVAYQRFLATFRGPRWDALVARGARVQRPLWASTSTKDPAYPDTLYVDTLIGPDTVNTMPESTIDAFVDHGTVARTVDADPAGAQGVLDRVSAVGVDLDDVARVLEEQGVAAFSKSFDELIGALGAKAAELGASG
ncbi:MAG TPA: transaldolase [Acidimicrobiales bacterium]|nr:transaldolase [Acidimicrobiales bacterium]